MSLAELAPLDPPFTIAERSVDPDTPAVWDMGLDLDDGEEWVFVDTADDGPNVMDLHDKEQFLDFEVVVTNDHVTRPEGTWQHKQCSVSVTSGYGMGRVTWAVSDDTIAKITVGGRLIHIGSGTITVTATAGGKSRTATVTLGAPPL